MRITHITVDLLLGNEGGDRVHDDDIHSAGTDHRLADVQRLFAGIRLGDIEIVNVHADVLRIDRIQRVFRVDVTRDAAGFLRFRDHVERQCGLAGGFRSVDFDDPAARDAADAERKVQAHAACRNVFDLHLLLVAELHDGALAVLLLDLTDRGLKCF